MPRFVNLGTTVRMDDADLFDRIMIERLKDGAHDVCDDIRVDMQSLVKDETECDWKGLISDIADLASILNVLSSYGVLDWFPEIPPEMQIQKPPPTPKQKPKPKKKKNPPTPKQKTKPKKK